MPILIRAKRGVSLLVATLDSIDQDAYLAGVRTPMGYLLRFLILVILIGFYPLGASPKINLAPRHFEYVEMSGCFFKNEIMDCAIVDD